MQWLTGVLSAWSALRAKKFQNYLPILRLKQDDRASVSDLSLRNDFGDVRDIVLRRLYIECAVRSEERRKLLQPTWEACAERFGVDLSFESEHQLRTSSRSDRRSWIIHKVLVVLEGTLQQ